MKNYIVMIRIEESVETFGPFTKAEANKYAKQARKGFADDSYPVTVEMLRGADGIEQLLADFRGE